MIYVRDEQKLLAQTNLKAGLLELTIFVYTLRK